MAAMMLASCSSDKLGPDPTPSQPTLEAGAVGFDAYTQRSTTRAGYVGDVVWDQLIKSKADGGGFGVFGYYTDNKEYDQLALPNFFWNQLVEYGTSSWVYDPVKYWPNEYGSSAISEDYDKVSFFAYAPYVEVDANSGKVTDSDKNTWGITQLSRNTASGDPIVKYIASFDPTKAVDLMWGVCDDTTWPIVVDGTDQKINNNEKGLPWIDVQRPAQVNQLMKFTFKHALAKLNVQVDYVADAYENESSQTINEDQTRIWVRSIRFNGIAMKGALNLNNTEAGANKPYWMNYNGIGELEAESDITIHDGRKDGKEGIVGASASNEKVLGLNPKIIQNPDDATAAYQPKSTTNTSGTVGVTKVAQNVFNSGTPDGCIYVIPTEEEMLVEIVYDVETIDNNLATTLADGVTKGSSIENRISKTIQFAPKAGTTAPVTSLKPGNAYQLKLHLGMNSVKLDADVLDWEKLQPGTETNLPSNMPEVAVQTSTSAFVVDAAATSYTYAVTGLEVGESLTATSTDLNVESVSIAPAASQTWEIVTVTLKANTTVSNVENTITVTGSKHTTATTTKITQQAHELNLRVSSIDTTAKTITLANTGTVTTWPSSSTTTDDEYVTINRSGVDLTYAATPSTNEFSISGGVITLNEDFKVGETYIITVKVGDAPAETVSFKVGGVILAPTASVVEAGTVTPARTLVGSPTVSWGSSDTAVATVDTDGVISGVAAGTATITATVSGSETGYQYLPTATCTVTVTAAP